MTDNTLPPVAFLGTGAMGSRMAARLIAAGFPLTVWNRTAAKAEPLAEAGAQLAASPADAVAGASIVLIMVEGDDASQAVWDGTQGIRGALAPDTLAIECSTLSPAHVAALADEAAARGQHFIEAPVSGSLPQAEAGTLAFLAGGTPRDIEKAELLFRHLGRVVHRLGVPPMATRAKLAINGMLACQVASAAEAIGFLAGAGLRARDVAALLADTPVASPIVAATASQIAHADFTPLFPISLAAKDLAYLAAEGGGAMPLATCAERLFGKAAPWRDENISAVAKLFVTPQPERTETK